MNKQELIKKITSRKEYSQLPSKDVEMAFSVFDKEKYLDEEKVKLTRDLLRKSFSVFGSRKLLNKKILNKKTVDEILKKHISTKERFVNYGEIYQRVLDEFKDNLTIFDLGAGINGLSYKYLKKEVDYIAVEGVGQLVELMKNFFKREKIQGKAYHISLFDLKKIKELIKKTKGRKIVFLFKVIDSLEMLQRDYSKRLLREIVPLSEKVVVSFATRSLGKREKFKARRTWILDFIKENFNVLDDFEISGERYLVFSKR